MLLLFDFAVRLDSLSHLITAICTSLQSNAPFLLHHSYLTLKTIVLQIKKKHFLTLQFCSFIVWLLSSLVNYRPIKTLLLSKEGFKRGCSVTQTNVFNEFVDFTGFDTKKIKLTFDCCHVSRYFCRHKTYSG